MLSDRDGWMAYEANPIFPNDAIRASLMLVADYQINSIAIPSFSTGIYHYPLEAALWVAVEAALYIDRHDVAITFVCFDDRTYIRSS